MSVNVFADFLIGLFLYCSVLRVLADTFFQSISDISKTARALPASALLIWCVSHPPPIPGLSSPAAEPAFHPLPSGQAGRSPSSQGQDEKIFWKRRDFWSCWNDTECLEREERAKGLDHRAMDSITGRSSVYHSHNTIHTHPVKSLQQSW